MKNLLKLAFAACIFAVSAGANAIVVTDVHNVNNFFNHVGETRSWVHDITDDGFSIGDTVNSAQLDFNLRDDNTGSRVCFIFCINIPDGGEWATIIIQDFDLEDGGIFEIDTGLLGLGVGSTGIGSLNASGLLSVTVIGGTGDFYLDDVTLSADVTTAPVSEPGTFALLGLGLMFLGFSRKKLS